MYPLAAGGGEPGNSQKYIRKAEACLWWFRRLAPGADDVYPMRALTPHECVAIQGYTLLSEEFVSTCHIPSYEAFLRRTDLTPAYVWQKRFLQHLQLGAPKKRWILKSPDHVLGLEALFAVFPDAYLVQTHRNPIEVLKSSADLTQVLRGLYGRPDDPNQILSREASVLAENTDRFIQFRDRHPELGHRIIDVKYSELTVNPLEIVRGIYTRLGSPFDESQAARVRRLASIRSTYSGRRASAEPFRAPFRADAEFGMFERYCTRFGLQFQGAERKR